MSTFVVTRELVDQLRYHPGPRECVTITHPEPWGSETAYAFERGSDLSDADWEWFIAEALADISNYYSSIPTRASQGLPWWEARN